MRTASVRCLSVWIAALVMLASGGSVGACAQEVRAARVAWDAVARAVVAEFTLPEGCANNPVLSAALQVPATLQLDPGLGVVRCEVLDLRAVGTEAPPASWVGYIGSEAARGAWLDATRLVQEVAHEGETSIRIGLRLTTMADRAEIPPLGEVSGCVLAIHTGNAMTHADALNALTSGSASLVAERSPATTISGGLQLNPNPARSGTRIRFNLESSSSVKLEVYDLAGRRVYTERVGEFQAGHHEVFWPARDDSGAPVASGVYFVRVEGMGFAHSRKVAIVR